jgi:hypothetical protein
MAQDMTPRRTLRMNCGLALSALIVGCSAATPEDPFVWRRWIGDGTGGSDAALALAFDREGNMVVVVSADDRPSKRDPNTGDWLQPFGRAVKLDANGKELWHADVRTEPYGANPVDVAVDGSGNVSVLTTRPSWLARLDARGHERAPMRMLDLSLASSVVADDDGNVFVVGSSIGKQPDYPTDLVVIKLDPDNNVVWTRNHDQGGHDAGRRVAIATDGSIVVGGDVGDTVHDVWIQKYTEDGGEIWAEPIVFATDGDDQLSDLAALPDGRLIAVGTSGDCDGAYGPCSAWANLYDVMGAAVWPRPFLLSTSEFQDPVVGPVATLEQVAGYTSADSVAVDASGVAVIVGVREDELWLQRIGSDGSTLPDCAGKPSCSAPPVYDHGEGVPDHRCIGIDPDGSLVLTWTSHDTELSKYGFSPAGGLWIGKLATQTLR